MPRKYGVAVPNRIVYSLLPFPASPHLQSDRISNPTVWLILQLSPCVTSNQMVSRRNFMVVLTQCFLTCRPPGWLPPLSLNVSSQTPWSARSRPALSRWVH